MGELERVERVGVLGVGVDLVGQELLLLQRVNQHSLVGELSRVSHVALRRHVVALLGVDCYFGVQLGGFEGLVQFLVGLLAALGVLDVEQAVLELLNQTLTDVLLLLVALHSSRLCPRLGGRFLALG